ncbi:Hypothetical_protein [Hexamita inflata]|uniref:Hypothetical_protein n=1 Tax=Hexamita inflata TaxID=28002 RepID=A0AA86QU28_9EUKA|nr:Hypothetical protein HINF_LOCUS47228 [Hexamita inflata]
MLSSITVILLQLKSYNQSVCVSNLLVNNNIFNYCQKTKSLNSAKLDSAVYLSQNHGHMFLNTELIQASTVTAHVSNINVNSFALFGLNLNAQNITGSTISVNLDFQVITGALVCIACDLFVHNSVLKFEARGKQVSAVLLETQDNVELKLTTIQYRLDSQQASGIAGVVRSKPSLFSVEGCKMSGFGFALSGNSGFIASDVQVRISLKLDAFFVCVNSPNALGQLSVAIDQTGAAQADCSICGADSVVYGLCGPKIPNSQLEGGQFVCSSPFELINGQCECQKGFVLNGSACVKIIDELQLLKSNTLDADLSAVKAGMDKAVQDQAKVNSDLDASIQSNATALEKAISDNGQLIASILNGNVSALNKRLENNATLINGQMLQAIALLQDQINELKKKKPCDSAINISTDDTYQIADRVVVCSLPIYVNRFDIAAVTHTVSSVTGFTSTVLQDAFIDVQSVYSSSVSPLFTVQKSFTNIKIQIAGQAVKSGSILSNSDTITIVEMKIVGKSGDMTGTGSQLNILTASSSNSAISNLLINISFKSASSNVALIGSVSGTLTIANYQVLGTYETTSGQMGLVTLLCNGGDVTIENVNLNPSSIAFGNQSSYLFCVVNGSQVELKGILLVLGSASQKQALFSAYTQYFQNAFYFGGAITYLNSTNIIITQLVYNSNQSCSAKYVFGSGFLIGIANGSGNEVTIQQLCFQGLVWHLVWEDKGQKVSCVFTFVYIMNSIIIQWENSRYGLDRTGRSNSSHFLNIRTIITRQIRNAGGNYKYGYLYCIVINQFRLILKVACKHNQMQIVKNQSIIVYIPVTLNTFKAYTTTNFQVEKKSIIEKQFSYSYTRVIIKTITNHLGVKVQLYTIPSIVKHLKLHEINLTELGGIYYQHQCNVYNILKFINLNNKYYDIHSTHMKHF